jgi:hypothetical protein
MLKILGTNVQNLVTQVAMNLGFIHPSPMLHSFWDMESQIFDDVVKIFNSSFLLNTVFSKQSYTLMSKLNAQQEYQNTRI